MKIGLYISSGKAAIFSRGEKKKNKNKKQKQKTMKRKKTLKT
jgi:hypothetical protein